MIVESIITLANSPVELMFRAMERSLRATGCTLPLLVIPYDDRRFQLPPLAQWLEDPPLYRWLSDRSGRGLFRKYACLTRSNYLFVDTDLIFLGDPGQALAAHSGFVATCSNWRDPIHCISPTTEPFFRRKSSTYTRLLFNSGQFACDRPMYDLRSLQAACDTDPATCFSPPEVTNDQPAINYLVHYSGIEYTNTTLPPHNIESSWAGDYKEDVRPEFHDPSKAPFLLHWAGMGVSGSNTVDAMFLNYLTASERGELVAGECMAQSGGRIDGLRWRLRKIKHGIRSAFSP